MYLILLQNKSLQWIAAIFLFLLLSGITLSCRKSVDKDRSDQKPIARVLDYKLYYSDVSGLVNKGTTKEDSLQILHNYIDSWIRQKLILHAAEKNLSEEKKKIEKQINDYRNSLLIYLYEKELVRQKLDTVVEDNAISEYYEKNKENYKLKSDIIRFRFLQLKKETPQLDSIVNWLQNNNPVAQSKLEQYSYKFAVSSYLNIKEWHILDELEKQLNLEIFQQEEFESNKLYKIEGKDFLYFLYVDKFQKAGAEAPISYVKESIRKIILNKRKLKLIKEIYNNVYEEALRKNKIEVYID